MRLRTQDVSHGGATQLLTSTRYSEVIYRNSDGHVIKFNILTNESEIVLTNTTFINFNVAKYSVSLI
ncbi:hypothetical protein NQZ68_006252 [Dissostichus eleginoides]|nr:hypothetical protein NQZ68_006252 [Dissostichus eleginoides]